MPLVPRGQRRVRQSARSLLEACRRATQTLDEAGEPGDRQREVEGSFEPQLVRRLGLSHAAITSISTFAPSGRAATAMVVRAGYGFEKYSAYTSFIARNSCMSVRYTVTLITSSSDLPAAPRIARRFRNICAVWAATPPATSLPVSGSCATC